MPPPQQAQLAVHVPDELQVGSYADFCAVWHNAHGFTIDFGALGLTQADAQGSPVQPVSIVARVKVPPSVIFTIARTIAENVSRYEAQFGPITPPPGEG
jgi:hypothetical protein